MTLLYLSPPKILTPFIDHYFIYEIEGKTVEKEFPDGMRILPSTYGRMGLFFSEPTIKRVDGKPIGVNPQIGISGFYTEPRNYISKQSVSMLIVGFTPLGLQQLIDFPLSEIMNQNVDAKDIFSEYDCLLNEVYECADWEARALALNEFFTLKFAHSTPDLRVYNALHCILASKGKLSVKDTASELSVSERTLHRIITRNIGISPKIFSSLVRFQTATYRLTNYYPSSLTTLAHATGYYDQAHFIHEFNQFFGDTPSTLPKLKRSLLGRFYDAHQNPDKFSIIAYI